MNEIETSPDSEKIEEEQDTQTQAKSGMPWFSLLNFILIIGLAGAAWYFWHQDQLKSESLSELQTDKIFQLSAQLAQKTNLGEFNSRLSPLEQNQGLSDSRINKLQQQSEALLASTEKLFELFGRDKETWKLAEVEYLLRISQQKLILENDFEGAALTLTAASEKLAEAADPGMLPVRVQISDEIATLKTRARPDLVGMTLLLSRLEKQIYRLKPGYQSRQKTEPAAQLSSPILEQKQPQTIQQQLNGFVQSLFTVKKQNTSLTAQPDTTAIDVTQTLADNLKLTRWALLERDAFQYDKLMRVNVQLFQQYYDLENAANDDFYDSLKKLLKSSIKVDKPDITQSLLMLKRIISKRENKPVSPEVDAKQATPATQPIPEQESKPEPAPEVKTDAEMTQKTSPEPEPAPALQPESTLEQASEEMENV